MDQISRAILVEGFLARREGQAVYLPVGIGQTAVETERVVAAFAGALRLWRVFTGGRF